MRLSDEHKFVLISNPRCGSTSLRNMLNPYSNIRSQKPPPEPWLKNHATAFVISEGMRKTGRKPEDYHFFTTIRNPWHRVTSFYAFGKSKPASVWHEPALSSASFADFVRHPTVQDRCRHHCLENMTQSPGGERIVKTVLRLEDFDQVLSPFLTTLLKKPIEVMHLNKAAGTAYQDLYTDKETIDIVADIFKSDIAFGQYRFEAN